MKRIKYKFLSCEINHGTEESPNIEYIYLDKSALWNEEAEEIAKEEAYNGEYEIIDDGDPESAPTQIDRIESQVTYTAMMTDTLIMET